MDRKLPTQEQIDAAEARAYVDEGTIRAALSRVPPSWTVIRGSAAHFHNGGAFNRGSVNVIYTVLRYDDGRVWVHVSASCASRCPTWEEMKRVKNDFIGEDRWAYQVFPSAKEYVNHHPYTLHLFALFDGAPALPDFTWGLGTL